MIERIEFYQRYQMTPQRFIERFKEEGTFIRKLHIMSVIRVEKDKSGADAYIYFTDNGNEEVVDLRPHWERGSDAPIKCTREGAMNLVRAVYAQTEKDLEELYAGGVDSLILDRNVGEKIADFSQRKSATYWKEVRKCEELLGPVLSRYTMVKAYYVRNKMTVEEIARIMGETPTHIANVIERLGLNRADSAKGAKVEYIDEEIFN